MDQVCLPISEDDHLVDFLGKLLTILTIGVRGEGDRIVYTEPTMFSAGQVMTEQMFSYFCKNE